VSKTQLTVLMATRNEEVNLPRTLASISGWVDQICVLDSESSDRTIEIARLHGAEVTTLPYEHHRIIPWIFQWGLDHLALRNDWILLLEADQRVTPELQREIQELLSSSNHEHVGFYLRRRQVLRGKPIRFGGYGKKRMLKLFRRGRGELDPVEQDTRVYVDGSVGHLRNGLEEWNRKEDSILFYLEKHLRYAEAFASEEHRRQNERLPFKQKGRLLGSPDERILWQKNVWYRSPLVARSFVYFIYRYVLLFGFLDGANGFLFHFLQAFWFRLVVDIRVQELRAAPGDGVTPWEAPPTP
jgi:glycosyltransferase involved in cell wall biosynthesis